MFPSNFDYVVAKSPSEAVALLDKHHDNGKLIAGGHSLLPMMKLRLASPGTLIDIGRIKELSGIKEEGNAIVIGALTTYYQLETSSLLQQKLPMISNAASHIGDLQVRNRGTIGGSSVHADPSSDMPAVLLAYEASFKVIGPQGERTIPAEDFFVDLLTSDVQPNELLTEIHIPTPAAKTGASYKKLANKASHYAVAGAAAVVTMASAGKASTVRLAITGAAAKPYRAKAVESALQGQMLDAKSIEAASTQAAEGVECLSDLHGSQQYRASMAAVYAKRALLEAMENAGK